MSQPESLDPGCDNLRWALSLLEGLARGGLRQVVISPGSRSTPLVLAARRQPALAVTAILDERSAAFFALGLARASARPVALVCTSGSALAHWFPAVIEASESGLPLILLSADRPPELRGWGANQTIDQTRFFGPYAREFHDPGPPETGPSALKRISALGLRAALVSQSPRPGPVHLNLPFREPLVPGPGCVAEAADIGPNAGTRLETLGAAAPGTLPAPLAGLLNGRGILCCGPMTRPDSAAAAILECAAVLGAPILADPLSGLRFTPTAATRIARYDSFLRNPAIAAALRPDWVIRIGGTPVSKTLGDWLEGVPAILVDPSGRWTDPTQEVRARIDTDARGLLGQLRAAGLGVARDARRESSWLSQWSEAERWTERLASDHLAQAPWCEAHLIGRLIERLPPGDGIFCANSLPIRQLDTWSGQGTRSLALFGHRGASGIDGQGSTLAGLSAGRRAPHQGVTGLLGDLSFLHDLSGLTLLERLDRPCIVLNNGGGRIFDYLPQRGLADLEPLWRTPQRVALATLARAFGLPHRAVDDAAGFAQALDESIAAGARGEPAGLIEVHLDAATSQRTHECYWRLVREHSMMSE